MRAKQQPIGPMDPTVGAEALAFVQRIVTLIVGLATGWLIVAVANQVDFALRCFPSSGLATVSACLCAIAMGVRLPRRVARALARIFGRERRRASHDSARVAAASDGQLLWTILAASAMLAGLGIALIPLAARVAAWVYHAATKHYFWLDETHAVLVAGLSLLVVLVPLILVGIVLVCLNQLAGIASGPRDRLLPRLLFAAAVGSALCARVRGDAPRPELLVLSAALPFFAVAILAAQRSAITPKNGSGVARASPTAGVVQQAGTFEAVVAIATIAVAGMAVLWSWLLVARFGNAGSYCVLCAAALGLAGIPSWQRDETTDVAMPIALAGLFSIVAAMSGALTADTTGVTIACALGTITVFTASRALGHARRRVLERTVSPNATATRLLFECVWWPGVALLVLAVLAPDAPACRLGLIALGLAVSAVGAVALLDVGNHRHNRRFAGAALVLAAAIGLTAWMPWVATRWTQPAGSSPPSSPAVSRAFHPTQPPTR